MKPMQEGLFLNVANEEYHADSEWEIPSLSSSLAKLLITETPRHCWAASSMNPKRKPVWRKEWDRGSAAHALILNSSEKNNIVVIKTKDWKTNAAKEARDEARAAGLIPILEGDRDELFEMRDAVIEQLEGLEGGNPLAHGHPEVTLRWKETLLDDGEVIEIWCRARADWHSNLSENLYDLKTSPGSINPVQWGKFTSWSIGAPYQAALYRSGIRRLTQLGILRQNDPDFVFLLAESHSPYCIGLVNFPPDIRQRYGELSADEKLTKAMLKWARCLAQGTEAKYWPAQWGDEPAGSVYIAEGARPIVTRAPAPEQEPMKADDPRYHVESHDAARGLAPAVDVNDDRDTSWAKGLVGKR